MFAVGQMFSLGTPSLDAVLKGGLAHAAVHEVLADPAHPATAAGFCLALALRASPGLIRGARPTTQRTARSEFPEASPGLGAGGIGPRGPDTDIVWIRQEAALVEAGHLYGPGLAALGLDPARLLLAHLRTPIDVMRAGLEAARCRAVAAVILETMDRGAKIDLTATRRLKLAAEKLGVTVFLLRASGATVAGAVETRWRVGPARAASDRPRFDIRLMRHRAGLPEMRWQVEWDHEQRAFTAAAPLSEPLVPLPCRRPVAA